MSDDPIYSAPSALPDAISAGAKQLVDKARQLGLTWTLRLATVSVSVLDNLSVVFDGDTTSMTGVVNISGEQLVAGDRVYVMIVPPAGNFIIGRPGFAKLGNFCGTQGTMTAGSTTSAVYVDQPGSPSITLTKRYTDTELRFWWAQTYFTSVAAVNALFAATTTAFGGMQIFLAKHNSPNGSLLSHTPISGTGSIIGVPAGTATWTGAWATAGGGGTLNVDGGDFWTMCIEEFWPSD